MPKIINPYPIRKATKADKKDVVAFYRRHGYSAKFMGFDICYVIKTKQQIIASVILSDLEKVHALHSGQESLAPSPQSSLFLHALFVDNDHRNQGLGHSLLTHCANVHRSIVCFSDQQLAPFYQQAQFVITQPHKLNETLQQRFALYADNQPSLRAFSYRSCD